MGKYESDRGEARRDDNIAPRKRPSAQQIASRKKAIHDQKLAIIIGCSVLAVALIVVVICLLMNAGYVDDGKILPNVYAAGIDLGGMTRDEAHSALRLAADKAMSTEDMVLILPNGALRLSPEDTHASVDVDAVVEAAYSYGRTGTEKEQQAVRAQAKNTTHAIALLPYMPKLDTEYIYQAVVDFCASHGVEGTPTTVTLTGERPEYDPERPTRPVTHQTMTIVTGTPDYNLSVDRLYAKVLDGYSINDLEINYEIEANNKHDSLTAEDIFKQYCLAPENAVQDEKTYEITPEVYGYGFDIDELQQLLDMAGYGETIELDLEFLFPEVITTDLDDELFVDELAAYTTTGTDSSARNHNLSISCQLLDGYVIAPGAVFSFNEALDRPTAQLGYKQAAGYQNGTLTDIIGGGIDQTASTLYYCALLADLDILERKNNDFAVDYIGLGLDVCIDWGVRDLKFINNTESPIRIVASAQGSSVSIQLLGVEERDYDVTVVTETLEQFAPKTIFQKMIWANIYGYKNGTVLEEGIYGYRVQTSMEKRNKQSGAVLSTTLVDNSTYSKRDETVVYIPSITDIWGAVDSEEQTGGSSEPPADFVDF